MTVAQLDQFGQAVLNGAGNGSVRLGPSALSQIWRVTGAAVQTSTATRVPTATLFLNGSTTSSLGGTYTGSNDSTDLNLELRSGQYLTCVWAGGDAGATATLSLSGTMEVKA